MIQLTDISIRAMLPLHPRLAKGPRLSIQLISAKNVLEETEAVPQDRDGIWKARSDLKLPEDPRQLILAIVVKGRDGDTQLLSPEFDTPTLFLEQFTEQSPECKFIAHNSSAQIRVTISSSIGMTTLTGMKENMKDMLQAVSGMPFSFNQEELKQLYRECPYPRKSHEKVEYLSEIGRGYYSLYKQSQDPAALDNSISIQKEAIDLGNLHPKQAQRLHHLSIALEARYNYNGNRPDIDAAIQASQNALRLTHRDSPERARLLTQLASTYDSRFIRLGDAADINLAISTYSGAVALVPDGNMDKLGVYNDLGIALTSRFRFFGDIADLEKAIFNLKNSVGLTPDGHPNKPSRYNNLGSALQARFECLGDLADLEMAITNQEIALRLTPDGHPDNPLLYGNLGSFLHSRFECLGDLTDLERAIFNQENALSLTPDGHPSKPSIYDNLGCALSTQFKRLGYLADLEMAILNQENAVSLTPERHPQKPLRYSNLGSSLQSRFERLGDIADLNRAIFNNENALSLTPEEHPDKPMRYSNLGGSIHSRFERLGDLADLDRAVSNQENAVKLTLNGHPDKPMLCSNLGSFLQSRFKRLGDLADLDRAIFNNENALSLTPHEHPSKASLYNNLGNGHESRFNRWGDPADLDRAISNLENAVRLKPDGHPNKVYSTSNLAFCYERRFELSGKISDLHLAHSLFATGAEYPASYPQERFKAALGWSRCAKRIKTSPISAYKCAIDQLPRIAWLGIPVSEQHSLLVEMGGAVRYAVAAAIDAEEYEMAVEWMEQGRSIVWQNLLKLRAPVDDLRAVYPQIAARLQSISQQLDSPAGREFKPQTREDHQPKKSHTSLAIEWDETIDQIRRLPNFESFLKPKAFDALSLAAHEGPVVILNVAQDRCDALALIQDENGVSSVVPIPLETFSFEKSLNLLKSLTGLLKLSGVRDGDTRMQHREQSKVHAKGMSKILLILWNDLVKPVIDGLAYQPQTSDLPPGDYNKTGVGHKLSDYAVSSYTPTLTAILDSSYPVAPKDFKLLTVAQPSAPGAREIPKTMEEVERIAKVGTGVSILSIKKEVATVERVLKGMRECDWVHLACHGKQATAKPMESGLILYDGTLKLSKIVKETLPNAEFAFLSACQTAMGDEKIAEESVHLAAGMLLAGYKGVIATMWSIKDDDGPRVAEVVYSRMLKNGKPNRKEAAFALHEAVKQLRESGADFTSWVPFIHIGR